MLDSVPKANLSPARWIPRRRAGLRRKVRGVDCLIIGHHQKAARKPAARLLLH